MGNVRFILNTEQPEPPRSNQELAAQRRSLKQFCQNTQFLDLQILEEAALDDSQATVTVRATLLQHGQDASFTERSLFKKHRGRWYYVEAVSES